MALAMCAAVIFEVVPWLGPLRVLGVATPLEQVPALASAILEPEPASAVGAALLDQETNVSVGPLSEPKRAARGPIAAQPAPELPPLDDDDGELEQPLSDPSGSMHAFYRALTRTRREEPGAITRILYHGDSLVASDYVTSTLRRKLQSQFGDAGHGFVLMANAWAAYAHADVFRYSTRGWSVSRIVGPYSKDGLYGLGGVSFKGPPGIRSQFGTAREGDYGRRVGVFEIAYLKQPGGGDLRIHLDGDFHSLLPTAAPEVAAAFHRVEVPDGEHLLELVTEGREVRAFGVVLERREPGVVLDAIGVQGARIRFLDKQDDAHWAEQLRWRKPDLLVFHFGANESGDGFAYSMPDYHRTMKDVIVQAQRAVPGASCLIVSALDRARNSQWGLITVPIIPHIVEQQEKTARDVGCAYWSAYLAMGGKGSMARWVRRGLGQADLTHPTSIGAERIGNWLYRALIEDYRGYLDEQAPAP